MSTLIKPCSLVEGNEVQSLYLRSHVSITQLTAPVKKSDATAIDDVLPVIPVKWTFVKSKLVAEFSVNYAAQLT